MKLIDAINKIDRTIPNHNWVDVGIFTNALNMNDSYLDHDAFSDKMKQFYLYSWRCTDTHVGMAAYFLDDEFVAVGTQHSRKSSEKISFTSKQTADKVRDFILSLESDCTQYSILDPDTNVDAYFTVSYGSQLLVETGYYNGKMVKVLQVYDTTVKDHLKWQTIDVELDDNSVVNINLVDFHIPIYIKQDQTNTVNS